MEDVFRDAEARMQKSIESLKAELGKLRTGRAHPGLVEHVMVDYYGTDTPLQHVANISVLDARTLAVQPWEKPLVPVVEKAIMAAELGLNPSTSGDTIRIPLPPLTEERRKELVKVVKGEAESARVAIRNIRRDANQQFKDQLKAKDITEDDERRAEERMQKLTDKFVAQVDEILTSKEADLLAV